MRAHMTNLQVREFIVDTIIIKSKLILNRSDFNNLLKESKFELAKHLLKNDSLIPSQSIENMPSKRTNGKRSAKNLRNRINKLVELKTATDQGICSCENILQRRFNPKNSKQRSFNQNL